MYHIYYDHTIQRDPVISGALWPDPSEPKRDPEKGFRVWDAKACVLTGSKSRQVNAVGGPRADSKNNCCGCALSKGIRSEPMPW